MISHRKPCMTVLMLLSCHDILIKQSDQTVKEVFNDPKQFNGKYVSEHIKCPGVYRCKREKLRVTSGNDSRGNLTEDTPAVYKITAVDEEIPDVDTSEEVLVILGLARP